MNRKTKDLIRKGIYGIIFIAMLAAFIYLGNKYAGNSEVKVLTITDYYKEIKTFKQPFPDRTHPIKSLPIDVVIMRMGHVQKDYSYRIAMSYFLREQYSLHPYHKFECLWRAYNCLFRNLTGTTSDNAGIRGMISHVLLHTDKYNQTCSCANAVDFT